MPPKQAKKKGGKQPDKKTVRKPSQPEEIKDLDEAEGFDAWFDVEPVEPLELTDEELKKDVTLLLSAENPQFSEEFVEFSFKDLEYKTLSNFPHTATLFSQTGSLVHKSLFDLEMGKDKEKDAEAPPQELEPKRKNKFNFCDRAVQTLNLALRDEILQAEPPPETRIAVNSTLIDMYEVFQEKDPSKTSQPVRKRRNDLSDVSFTAKVLDRMINQNKYFDVILDFGFYDNPCDEFLEHGMGSLLPLWKFGFKDAKGMNVMSITWNRFYADIFAVGFGTSEFQHDVHGYICLFTLKSPLHPERVFYCETSVQSVDFHHQWEHLLVAGFLNGSVAVFDLRRKEDSPLAISQKSLVEHADVVSQVKWLDDNIDEQHNFCSISSDGKVINWCLSKSELVPYLVISLKSHDCIVEGLEETKMAAINCGVSVSFNNNQMNLFLVGTEEGLIHKCSALYCDRYLTTYYDHNNIVYNVEWNPYHPRVFLTCSADWTIRIWDCDVKESVFNFDMFNEIKRAAWAPFSSTLFAATTADGKIHIFDLTMNRQIPTCSYAYNQKTLKKPLNLSSIAFNPKLPIIVAGDDRGCVICFKLSPNLRASIKGLTELEWPKFVASEIDKMEKVLKLAKGPEKK